MKFPRRVHVLLFAAPMLALLLAFALFRIAPESCRAELLFRAAHSRHMLTCRVLIWAGADVNYCIGSGGAMHFAALNGDVDFMQTLVDLGANVDLPVKSGVTPLYQAHEYHQPKAEQFLLAHGANSDISQIHPP